MKTTRENQKLRYTTDQSYNADADNLKQDKNNRFSLRNQHGLYFDLKRMYEFVRLLNKENITLKDKKILDIGCHHGHFTNLFAYLKKDSREVYGIDFMPQFVKKAKEINPGINFSQVDLFNGLPFPDSFFDLIICNYVFNCVPHKDLKRTADLIVSKLKREGYLIFFDFYDSPLISLFNTLRYGNNRKKEKFPLFNNNKVNNCGLKPTAFAWWLGHQAQKPTNDFCAFIRC